MNQALTQRLVLTALLLTTVATAQAGANNNKSTEHQSKFSKVAFWRHHNDTKKNAKHDAAKPATSKQAQAKKAEVKPVAAKQSQASKPQLKPVSAKQSGHKTDPKQNSTKATSASTKKTMAKTASAKPKSQP